MRKAHRLRCAFFFCDVYVDLAKAWIDDKDAVPNKALMYYECIVK